MDQKCATSEAAAPAQNCNIFVNLLGKTMWFERLSANRSPKIFPRQRNKKQIKWPSARGLLCFGMQIVCNVVRTEVVPRRCRSSLRPCHVGLNDISRQRARMAARERVRKPGRLQRLLIAATLVTTCFAADGTPFVHPYKPAEHPSFRVGLRQSYSSSGECFWGTSPIHQAASNSSSS
jgi:hypothetical protein